MDSPNRMNRQGRAGKPQSGREPSKKELPVSIPLKSESKTEGKDDDNNGIKKRLRSSTLHASSPSPVKSESKTKTKVESPGRSRDRKRDSLGRFVLEDPILDVAESQKSSQGSPLPSPQASEEPKPTDDEPTKPTIITNSSDFSSSGTSTPDQTVQSAAEYSAKLNKWRKENTMENKYLNSKRAGKDYVPLSGLNLFSIGRSYPLGHIGSTVGACFDGWKPLQLKTSPLPPPPGPHDYEDISANSYFLNKLISKNFQEILSMDKLCSDNEGSDDDIQSVPVTSKSNTSPEPSSISIFEAAKPKGEAATKALADEKTELKDITPKAPKKAKPNPEPKEITDPTSDDPTQRFFILANGSIHPIQQQAPVSWRRRTKRDFEAAKKIKNDGRTAHVVEKTKPEAEEKPKMRLKSFNAKKN